MEDCRAVRAKCQGQQTQPHLNVHIGHGFLELEVNIKMLTYTQTNGRTEGHVDILIT